jgi:hypothetical protein
VSSYDPATLTLDPGPTAYTASHEYAHQAQNARQTPLWCLWTATNQVPVFGYWTRLLVEVEATAMALVELWRIGLLEPQDVREAGGYLWSYIRGLFHA